MTTAPQEGHIGASKVPAIVAKTGIHRRTIQQTIAGLSDIGITCEFVGSNRTGQYEIKEWGPIRRDWVAANHQRLANIISVGPLDAL